MLGKARFSKEGKNDCIGLGRGGGGGILFTPVTRDGQK